MHGVMRKTYSLLALRDMMTALHCVREKTCSLPYMRLLFCTMSEGRRVVSSAQGRRVVSSLSGNASAVHWDLFLCQM